MLNNQTITSQMRFETAVSKCVNGVVYKSYANTARYIYLMFFYDKTLKELRKAIKKHCKDNKLYINNGVFQKESAVAGVLLKPDSYDTAGTAKNLAVYDIAVNFHGALESALQNKKVNAETAEMETLTAAQIIANIESFLMDNSLNYRTVIQSALDSLKTETAETETAETAETAETETAETLDFETICAAVKQLNKKQLANLDIMIQGILTGNAETAETAETRKRKKQKAS